MDEARRKAEEERTEQERRTRVERIREQQEAERRAQAQVTDRMEAERRALRARTERTLQEARTEVQSIAVNALHERVTRERERLTRKISTIVREQNTERTLARWKKHRGVMTYHEQMQRVQSTARQIHEIEERLTVLGRKAAHQQERLADTEARHRQLNGHEVDVSVRGIRRRLEKIGRKIERTQRRLGEAQQANHALQQGVIQHTSVAEHVDDEWRRLLALPQVLCGSVAKDCIEIYTAPVIVTVQGERIDLGNYRVVVRPGQSGPAIRCTVSTRRDNGGHLYGSGNFCYGSRNEEMRAFIRRREYLSAIVLALEALHHMNENDENTARLHYLEVTDVLATTVP